MTPLEEFSKRLQHTPNLIEHLRNGLIGDGIAFETPFGRKDMLYADYVASGRALRQIEEFVTERVLPYYANTHTEASYCGAYMTHMRDEARRTIAKLTGAGPDCHVLFVGGGATAGINRLVKLLEVEKRIAAGEEVTVLIGPYEHHSNILPWRESKARVIEIPEADHGGPDLDMLAATLAETKGSGLVVGSFSGASNVTGIVTDSNPVTQLLKQHGALAIWDYAGGAPYLPMDMGSGTDGQKDAIVFSAHKFPGGPAASGVLIVRNSIDSHAIPTAPGGGTVTFVSPWSHAYSTRLEAREESGTPNVVGDIRAALVMLVKEALGSETILARDTAFRNRALAAWSNVPEIRLLGHVDAPALPIFSFQILQPDGELLHHQLFTTMLSDVHGVQARGGCACAGPYAHRLLGIDSATSDALFRRLGDGHEAEKPGWIRINFSYLLSDQQADRIIEAVIDLAKRAPVLSSFYRCDLATARFHALVSPMMNAG